MRAADRPGGTGAPAVALVGPTATGKTTAAIAVALAERNGPRPVELVSVDSMAVYRGMDVGTAKPSAEARAAVAVHLVDLVEPHEEFTVQRYQTEARRALEEISSRDHDALLVGGTGLYLRAVVDRLHFPGRYPGVAEELAASIEASGPEGSEARRARLAELHGRLARLDPVAARRMSPSNSRRLLRALEVTVGSGRPFSSFGPGLRRYPRTPVPLVGLRPDQGSLERRVGARFEQMLAEGFLAEVEALASRPEGLSRTARQALGYRELLAHVEGDITLDEAATSAIRRTCTFARRQMAWFRRDPRIVWVDPEDDPVGAVRARLAGAGADGGSMRDWDHHDESAPA